MHIRDKGRLAGLAWAALLSVSAQACGPGRAAAPDFGAVRGGYDLSDGRRLHIGGTATVPVISLGDSASVAMPIRDGVLRSADGRLTLHFDACANGLVAGVRLIERRPQGRPA